jgi:hypothetical protein
VHTFPHPALRNPLSKPDENRNLFGRRRLKRLAAFAVLSDKGCGDAAPRFLHHALAGTIFPLTRLSAIPHVEEWRMLYWLPRLCLLVLAGVLIGFGLFPRTSQGVAYTLLVIMMGLGLLSATLYLFPPGKR